MQPFEHYYTAWTIYIGLGACFLGLWFYVTKNWSAWINIPLSSLLFALMFAPTTSMKAENGYLIPATLVAIFDSEHFGILSGKQEGIDAFIAAVIPIGLTWLIAFLVFIMLRVLYRKLRYQQDAAG